MPIISEFEGIEIYLYFDDHMPPHFHAKYEEAEALVEIENSCVLKGAIPSNKLKLVLASSELHRNELYEGCDKAKNLELPAKINPLK